MMIMMKKDKEKLKVKVFEDRNHLIEELDRVFSQKSALITFIDDFRNKLKLALLYRRLHRTCLILMVFSVPLMVTGYCML